METIAPRADARKTTDTAKACHTGTNDRRGASALCVKFRLADDPIGKVREAFGRFAWALLQLHRAGAAGCTPITAPAPRWSHYIFGLRNDGVDIETVFEDHGGQFAGRHGRYRLVSQIEVIEVRS